MAVLTPHPRREWTFVTSESEKTKKAGWVAHDLLTEQKLLSHLLSLKSGVKMSFPGWSTDLHIRPSIRISSQQHFSRWIWSVRLSSIKPEDTDKHRQALDLELKCLYTPHSDCFWSIFSILRYKEAVRATLLLPPQNHFKFSDVMEWTN